MTQVRWARITEWPLTVAALIFLAAYSWQVIGAPAGTAGDIAEITIWVTWATFVADYVMNLALSRQRWRWFYTHLFDLVIVALPILRPLRLLRLVIVLSVVQRTAGTAFRGRVVVYAAGASTLLVYVAAVAMLDAERGQGSIETFQDGLWWAFVTITTVGYGDYYPVTIMGRAVAVGVMLGGIALIGVVTASLASWIVDKVAEKSDEDQAATHQEVLLLTDEVRQLRRLVEQRNAVAGRPD